MAKTPELAALVEQPFELLEELERRQRVVLVIGQRIGDRRLIAVVAGEMPYEIEIVGKLA